MAILQKQIPYAKELDDVMLALVTLVEEISAKKPTAQIVNDEFKALVDAIDNFNDVKNEFALDRKTCFSTVGFRGGEILNALV